MVRGKVAAAAVSEISERFILSNISRSPKRPPNESTESRNPGTLEHVDTEGDLVNSFDPALKVLRGSLHPQLIPIRILLRV